MKLVPILAFAAILAGCGRNQGRPVEAAPARAVEVRVAAASLQEWPAVYEATGTVRAHTTGVVSSKVTGYVQQVNARAGERVSEGQVLVTLDTRELETNLRRAEAGQAEAQSAVPEVEQAIAAAKANLDLAQATFRRIEDLYAKKSVSNQEFDEASARLKAAQAAHEMAVAKRAQVQARIAGAGEEQRAASIMRDYASIAAPFAGVVTERSVEPGNLAVPGAPLLTIEREGAYQLEASVEESKLPGVRTGQTVNVSIDGCQAPARVSEIVPAVDAASRSYIVKIALPCPAARSGMFGRAEFPQGTRRVIAIPEAAVLERGQLQTVFVAENAAAHSRIITAGRKSQGMVEVLSGLSDGEKVVVPVPSGFADGAPVEVRP